MRRPETEGSLALEGHGVDGHDAPGTGQPCPLDGCRSHATDAEHGHVVTRLDPGPQDGRAPPSRDPTGHEAGPVEGEVVVDLDEGSLVAHGVAGEGAEHAEDAKVLTPGVVAGRLVAHLPAVGDVHPHVAEPLVSLDARGTVTAGGQEAGHHMVAGREGGHAGPDLLHDAGALVAADHRAEEGHVAGQEVLVGMAQPGSHQPDEDLVVLGRVELDVFDLPLAARLPQHGRLCPHGTPRLVVTYTPKRRQRTVGQPSGDQLGPCRRVTGRRTR